jgi:hypothetical protein
MSDLTPAKCSNVRPGTSAGKGNSVNMFDSDDALRYRSGAKQYCFISQKDVR